MRIVILLMRSLVASLCGAFANLRAGARLALFARVQRQDFRVDAAQMLLFFVVSALVDNAGDWIRAGPGATLDWGAFGAEASSFAVLVVAAVLLAWMFAEAALVIALPVIVLASLPLVQIANVASNVAVARDDVAPWVVDLVYYLVLAWFLAVLWRAAFVAMQPGARRLLHAFVGLVLLAIPLVVPDGVLPNTSWWQQPAQLPALDASNPASEPVIALQRELQEEMLGALDDHTQGETDLYFLAFAGDGAAAWRAQLARAKKTMDEHWGTRRRSVVYVNDPATLTESPMATVSHLREALEEIGSAIDVDEDVVMLFIAGHSNSDGSLRVSFPPLALVPLTGGGLSHLLMQAGIRWRVIVVAACSPQPFIDALADEQTLIIASAPQGNACRDSELTRFTDALFGDALVTSTPIVATFEAVRRKLERNGAAPLLHVGSEIGAQLARLRSTAGTRASLRMHPVRG